MIWFNIFWFVFLSFPFSVGFGIRWRGWKRGSWWWRVTIVNVDVDTIKRTQKRHCKNKDPTGILCSYRPQQSSPKVLEQQGEFLFFNVIHWRQLSFMSKYIQSPLKVSEQKGQFLLFLIYTVDNWVSGEKMYTRWKVQISVFISWYFYLELLNDLEHITFCIRPPQFLGEQKHCYWQVFLVA